MMDDNIVQRMSAHQEKIHGHYAVKAAQGEQFPQCESMVDGFRCGNAGLIGVEPDVDMVPTRTICAPCWAREMGAR